MRRAWTSRSSERGSRPSGRRSDHSPGRWTVTVTSPRAGPRRPVTDDVLERPARDSVPEVVRPRDPHAHVGGSQVVHRHAGAAQHRHPLGVRPGARPAGAAEGQHGDVGGAHGHRSVGSGEPQAHRCWGVVILAGGVGVGPPDPAAAGLDGHAEFRQSSEPRPQQRRGPEGLREDPAARPHEGRLPQGCRPRPQVVGPEGLHGRAQPGLGRAVAGQERVERLGVGEVQPSSSGQQQLAADRSGVLEHRDDHAGGGQHLRRHQSRRSAAHDEGRAGGRRGRGGRVRHAATLRVASAPIAGRGLTASTAARTLQCKTYNVRQRRAR